MSTIPTAQPGMWQLIHEYDWASTALGPIESWAPELRVAVNMLVGCGFPATLQWGRELVLLYNDAYVPLIGARHPEALGRPILESFPEISETYQPFVDRVWQGETVLLKDQVYRYLRGTVPQDSWFNLSYSPVRALDGNVAGILAIGFETTQHVLAEDAKERAHRELRRSEERLRRVLETEAVGVIFFDGSGTLTDANDVFLHMTGYSDEEVRAGRLNWRSMTPEEWLRSTEEQMEKLAQTGKFGPFEKEYYVGDGSRRWGLFAGQQLGDGTTVAYCIDVTSRKLAEEALRRSENLLHKALATETVGVLFFRLDGRIVDMNSTFERMSGYMREELRNLGDWESLTAPEFHEATRAAARNLAERGETAPYEKQLVRKDGSRWWGLFAPTRLNGSGKESECVEFILDVTERRAATERLRESEKLAVVGRLASSISHEINNPLEAVTNLIYLAQQNAESPETLRYLKHAQLELARVSHIATQTLRFSRQNSGPAATDVADLINSVLTLYEGRLRGHGVQVRRDYRKHHCPVLIANELRQVLANLIANAIDAMKRSPRKLLWLRVQDASEPRDGRPGVRITIADTGEGMSSATQRRMGEPFFTTKEATGTGLGLWVTRQIVQKNNGSLRVRSRRRSGLSGTVFSVFLPRVAE